MLRKELSSVADTHDLVVCFCRYPLYGGMQDWNYLYANCLELTLEINDNKWPPFIEVLLILLYWCSFDVFTIGLCLRAGFVAKCY